MAYLPFWEEPQGPRSSHNNQSSDHSAHLPSEPPIRQYQPANPWTIGRTHTTTHLLILVVPPSLPLNTGLPSPDGKKTSPPISVKPPLPTLSDPSGIRWQRGPGRSNPNMESFVHDTRQMHGHDLPDNGENWRWSRLRNSKANFRLTFARWIQE